MTERKAIVVADANYMNNQLNRLQGTDFNVDNYPVFDIEQLIEEDSLSDYYFDEVHSEPINVSVK